MKFRKIGDCSAVLLNANEVATAIDAYLVAHGVCVSGPRTIRMDAEAQGRRRSERQTARSPREDPMSDDHAEQHPMHVRHVALMPGGCLEMCLGKVLP